MTEARDLRDLGEVEPADGGPRLPHHLLPLGEAHGVGLEHGGHPAMYQVLAGLGGGCLLRGDRILKVDREFSDWPYSATTELNMYHAHYHCIVLPDSENISIKDSI